MGEVYPLLARIPFAAWFSLCKCDFPFVDGDSLDGLGFPFVSVVFPLQACFSLCRRLSPLVGMVFPMWTLFSLCRRCFPFVGLACPLWVVVVLRMYSFSFVCVVLPS